MTKSALAVAGEALAVGARSLPAQANKYSRKNYALEEDRTAAVDLTELETRHAPMHFQRRCGRIAATHAAWPKLTAVCLTISQLIVGAVASRGPSQDSPDFPAAMRQAASNL
jgi:hypothetical protein